MSRRAPRLIFLHMIVGAGSVADAARCAAWYFLQHIMAAPCCHLSETKGFGKISAWARGGRGGVHFTFFLAMENRRWVIRPAHPVHPAHPVEIRKWSLEAWSGASLRAGGGDDVSSTETPSKYLKAYIISIFVSWVVTASNTAQAPPHNRPTTVRSHFGSNRLGCSCVPSLGMRALFLDGVPCLRASLAGSGMAVLVLCRATLGGRRGRLYRRDPSASCWISITRADSRRT